MSSPTNLAKNNFRADLHCHTSCSDGSFSPLELVAHAKKIGLTGLSITDHDTVAAYSKALPAAKEAGLLLGVGVEFSSHNGPLSVHMLGYNLELDHPALKAFCLRHAERRQERNRAILEKLARLGMVLDPAFLKEEDGRTVGRAHIALQLVKKGYVKSTSEAFQRFIGDGKPSYVSGPTISTDETLKVIHEVGGKAFIAHPHLLTNYARVKKLLDKPFDGIECYYGRALLEQAKPWVKLAKERGLLISGGSDFHGSLRPDVPLGASWVDEETFNKIFSIN